jgi:hypothetical protein
MLEVHAACGQAICDELAHPHTFVLVDNRGRWADHRQNGDHPRVREIPTARTATLRFRP